MHAQPDRANQTSTAVFVSPVTYLPLLGCMLTVYMCVSFFLLLLLLFFIVLFIVHKLPLHHLNRPLLFRPVLFSVGPRERENVYQRAGGC